MTTSSVRRRLLIEHQRVALGIDRMERLLVDIGTVSIADIVDARWALARHVLSHLDADEALVFAALENDRRAHAVEAAGTFRWERDELAERLREHARRFWTDEAIDADRTGYHASLAPHLAALRLMLEREERLLYPLLDDAAPHQGGVARPGRWLAEAWRYRAAAPAQR